MRLTNIFREANGLADALAKAGVERTHTFMEILDHYSAVLWVVIVDYAVYGDSIVFFFLYCEIFLSRLSSLFPSISIFA